MSRLFLRGFVFSLCLLTGTSGSWAAKIATVADVIPALTSRGVQLEAGSGVDEDARLTTGPAGRGEIVFIDGSKLLLGPSTSLTVTRSLMRSGNKFKKLGLRTTRGAVRWISGSSGSPAYSLFALNATIGIRGTVVDITVRNGAAYVALVSGQADVCARGKCQVLRRACDYVEIRNSVSPTRQVAAAFKSRNSAASVLPYLARPSSLPSRFRVGGGGCLTHAAVNERGQPAPQQVPRQEPPPPPPPPPPPKDGHHHHHHGDHEHEDEHENEESGT